MRKKETPQQVFFDRWAKTYDRTVQDYAYGAPQRIFDAVWPCVKFRPEPVLRMLDLGIGTGMTSKPFVETGRMHITGVDISNRMMERGRAAGAADEFIQMNLERDDLPFAEKVFDVAISGGTFEFIYDPEDVIREISRVLRPAGIACVTFETPETKDLYPPGIFQGILENGEDRVIVQRFAVQDFRPCLYKKYLFSADIIQRIFEGYGIVTLKNEGFTAYKWPGGRDVVYNMYLGQKI